MLPSDGPLIERWSCENWWTELRPERCPQTGLWRLADTVLTAPDGRGAADLVFQEAGVQEDWPGQVEALMQWLADGYDLHADILPAVREGSAIVQVRLSLRLYDPMVRGRPRSRRHRARAELPV